MQRFLVFAIRLRPHLALLGLVAALQIGCAEDTAQLRGDDDSAGEGAAPGAQFDDPTLKPRALTATALDGAIVLDWEDPEAFSPSAFWVAYRASLPGPPWDGAGSTAGPSPVRTGHARTYSLSGLSNGVAYFVAVAADVDGAPGPYSEWAKAIPRREGGAMVLVPAGAFTMGADSFVWDTDEEPAHPVWLDSFWMDRYVATNLDYQGCVDAGACTPPNPTGGFLPGVTSVDDYFGNPLHNDYPVVNLDYAQAVAYCAWQGKRLPTEAEWEKAARANLSLDEHPHVWGDAPPGCDLANYSDEGILCHGGPVPVGTYAAVNVSPYGVAEMAGNVWQWVHDWYGENYYAESPCRNPKGPAEGTMRTLRGGAWYYPTRSLSVVYRNQFEPTFTPGAGEFGDYRGFGVRCVKDAPGVPCDPELAACALPEGAVCPEDELPDPAESDADGWSDNDGHDTAPQSDADASPGSDADIGQGDAETQDAVVGDIDGGIDGGASEVSEPDAEDLDVPPADDSVSDAPEPVDVPEPDVPPADCSWPQDKPKNPDACNDAIPPACPSGWFAGCTVGYCTCVMDVSTEPSACAQEAISLSLGWRDGQKNFHPFQTQENYEMCQGFQGGGTFHVAVFIEIDDKGYANGANTFTTELHALARVYGIRLGGASIKKATLTKQPNGKYMSQLIQVVFETCSTQELIGLDADLDVMLRLGDDKFGRAKAKVKLIDNVNGPFLDPEQQNPC